MKKYQSKGVGKKFMTYILKTLKIKSANISLVKLIIIDQKILYKKLKFKELGKKIGIRFLHLC